MGEPIRTELVAAPKVKSGKKRRTTVRLEVELGDTTLEACPEFSYTELLKKHLNKDEAEPIDPNDPFGEDEDHDKLMALAKSFEAKYGPKPGSKKKVTSRLEDLVDLGEGYDEDDPFVDNSEAYDEYVPDNMTTAHGGFYINMGALDMRQISDDSDSDFYSSPVKKKKKLKRLLDSDSEVNDTNGVEGELVPKKKRGRPKKKRYDEHGNEIFVKEKKRKKLMMEEDGHFWKKKVKSAPGQQRSKKTVTELFKQQLGESTPNSGSTMESSQSSSSNMDTSTPIINDMTNGVTTHETETPKIKETPNLPDRLPSKLIESIDKIKKAAKASLSGKQKFFTHSVNRILLDIDLHVHKMPSSHRVTIYEHIASYLPCGYHTLVKRAAKLRENHQERKTHLEGPQENLRDAISRVMPDLIKRHESEVEAAQQAFNLTNNINGENSNGLATPAGENGEDEKKDKRRFMPPRRKFEWNGEISGLLCELVRVQMEMCEKMQVRIPSAEEYLMDFLEEEVKPLWPKGWMTSKRLYKESHDAHARWTDAEALLKPKKTAGSKPGTPVNVGGTSVVSAVTTSASSTLTTQSTSPSPQSTPITVHTSPVRISPPQAESGSSSLKISPTRPGQVSPMPHLSPVLPVVTAADSEAHSPHGPPNLLDYATNSWVSAKSGAGKSVSTAALSFTTTTVLGNMGTMASLVTSASPAAQALKSMSLLAGQEQSAKSASRKIQLQEGNVSSSTSTKPQVPAKVSPSSSSQPAPSKPAVKPVLGNPDDYLAQFRAFTQTFNATSPNSDSLDGGDSPSVQPDTPEATSTVVSWTARSSAVSSKPSPSVTVERSATMPFTPSLLSVQENSSSKQGIQNQYAKPSVASTSSVSSRNPSLSATNSLNVVLTKTTPSSSSALSSIVAVVKPRPTTSVGYVSPQLTKPKSHTQTLIVSSSATRTTHSPAQQSSVHATSNLDQSTPTGPPRTGLFGQRTILGQMHPPQASVSQVKPRSSPVSSYNQQVSTSSSPVFSPVSSVSHSGSHSGQSSMQHTSSPSMSGVSGSGGVPLSPSSPRAAARSVSPSGQFSRSGVSSTSPSQHRTAGGLGHGHVHGQRSNTNTAHNQIARPVAKVDSRLTMKATPKTSQGQSSVHSTNPGIPQPRPSNPSTQVNNTALAKLAYAASRKPLDSHSSVNSASSHQYVLHGGLGSSLQSPVPSTTLHSSQLGYAQSHYSKSLSPSSAHDRHQSSSSVTSSVPRDQPLYGGFSFDQLQEQAVSVANKQRLPVTQSSHHPSSSHASSTGPSLWRPNEHVVTPSTLSSSSYNLSHIATTVANLFMPLPTSVGHVSPYVGLSPILPSTPGTLPSPEALLHQGSNPFSLQSSPQASRTPTHPGTSPHSAQSHHY